MTQIKWAPHIPLIGGGPVGAEMALGTAPEKIYSLPGFLGNDKHYVNHQNVTLGRNIDYVPLDPSDRSFHSKLNIVIGTPPCAALSQLNCGKNETVKGSNCGKNEFMYIVAEQGIHCFNADVIIIENAPALATNKGQGVADRLHQIAIENDYSLTLYATSTEFHGIPQSRNRTFAMLWRSKKAPKLDWYKRDRLNFADYLNTTTGDLHNEPINPKLVNEPYAAFIKHKTGRDAREVCIERGIITSFNYVNKSGLLKEANEWFNEVGHADGIKWSEHAMKKFGDGLGIWDGSTHIFAEKMNAVIGRNMNDTVHPTESRSLTIREAMHMMGLPPNFELLGGKKSMNHIAQNIPTCTAADMVRQAVKYINGELPFLESNYVKQNNHNESIDFRTDLRVVETLEGFLE